MHGDGATTSITPGDLPHSLYACIPCNSAALTARRRMTLPYESGHLIRRRHPACDPLLPAIASEKKTSLAHSTTPWNPDLFSPDARVPYVAAAPPVTLTIELDETLASLAVDHRDGGLLATESLDLVEGREAMARRGGERRISFRSCVGDEANGFFLGFTVFCHISPRASGFRAQARHSTVVRCACVGRGGG